MFRRKSITQLIKMKTQADDLYYNSDKTMFSDETYDSLVDEIKRRVGGNNIPNSIGAPVRERNAKVRLPYHMGSLDKNNEKKMDGCKQYVAEEKLDGVACLFHFTVKEGLQLLTRGNGSFGSDITHLAPYLRIPKNLKSDLSVRGELIMKKNVFNTKYAGIYANARNMVSGKISAKIVDDSILTDINFVAYEIVNNTEIPPSKQIQKLNKLGFDVVNFCYVSQSSLEMCLINMKMSSEYEIDGIVCQIDEPYTRNTNGNPSYAFAFKILSDVKTTRVNHVEWNVSKWKVLKPRIKIDPVSICGVTINYVTGFNAKYIESNCIGPGAIIELTRSGDVIPHITKIVKKASKADMPDDQYTWSNTGVDIIAKNSGKESEIKLICSFFSSLDIKHVGKSTVAKMYENGLTTILKIINAKHFDFIGGKTEQRALDNIKDGIKRASVPDLLAASGIFGFGISNAKLEVLFKYIPDVLDRKNDAKTLTIQIAKLPGFSMTTSKVAVSHLEEASSFINNIRKNDFLL